VLYRHLIGMQCRAHDVAVRRMSTTLSLVGACDSDTDVATPTWTDPYLDRSLRGRHQNRVRTPPHLTAFSSTTAALGFSPRSFARFIGASSCEHFRFHGLSYDRFMVEHETGCRMLTPPLT